MVVGIFRTNICTQQDKNTVIQAIRTRFNISDCTIDTEDCDHVLRVVNNQLSAREDDIILFIRQMGFQCDILD
jgi:hypothetical protein